MQKHPAVLAIVTCWACSTSTPDPQLIPNTPASAASTHASADNGRLEQVATRKSEEVERTERNQAPPSRSNDVPRVVSADETHPELWVHEPVSPSPTREKYPVVLIAPAGSNLLTGMHLSAHDRSEHLPWVREGYLVVAYELRGAASDSEELDEAMTTYWNTMAGVTDRAR